MNNMNMAGIREKSAKIFLSPRFAEFLVLGLVFLFCIRSIGDFDVWYHLKAGEYNFANWTVLRHDVFSFSASGAEWISHSWLAEMIFYLIYACAGGIWGLIFFSALMAVLVYFIVLRTAELRGAPPFFSALLVLPLGYLTFELFVPRPQIFSYVFLVSLIYLLERWRRNEDSKIFFLTPVLMLVWTNTHASAILGFFVVSAFVAAAAASHFFKSGFPGMFGKIKKPFFVCAASFAILFLNPSGYKAPAYFYIVAPWNKVWAITEWFSLSHFLNILQARIYILLMAVFLLAYAIGQIKKWRSGFSSRRRKDFFDWILVSAFSILPWISIRHIAYFPIVALPPAAEIMAGFPKILARLKISPSRFALVALALVLLAYFPAFGNLPSEPVSAKVIPARAVDFMEEHRIKGPIFNQPAAGGYLIWRLWPKERVFTDGRVDVYRGNPAYDYLRLVVGQSRDEGDFFHQYGDKLIDEYGFNVFLLNYALGDADRREVVRNLSFHLLSRHDFRLVFWDSAALILIKNSPENRDLIERFGYRIISPFDAPADIPFDLLEEAVKEIERALEASPGDDFLERHKSALVDRLFPIGNFNIPLISPGF